MGTEDRDQFDDLLDGALKRYGEVEPRVGLEGRVLATLSAAGRQRHWWTRLAWGLAVAASVCAVVVVAVLMRSQHSGHPVAEHRPLAAGTDTVAQKSPATVHDEPGRTSARRRKPESMLAKKSRQPREFPSRRPLSQQETMLVEYVDRYPKEAILVAKEQDEFQKRVEQAEKEIDAGSSSDQEER